MVARWFEREIQIVMVETIGCLLANEHMEGHSLKYQAACTSDMRSRPIFPYQQ